MKRKIDRFFAAALALAAFLHLSVPRQAIAQTNGYVTSYYGIQPFDPSNASLLGWIHISVPESGVPAVSSNGSTLYVPFEGSKTPGVALGILLASTGELIGRVPGVGYAVDQLGPTKVLVTPNGTTAFVMCNDSKSGPSLIGIVNLAMKAVTGYFLAENGQFIDAALSPDGTHIFASVQTYSGEVRKMPTAFPQSNVPLYDCPGSSTSCEFNTSTLKLENQTNNLFGNIKVSQDRGSLYVIGTQSGQPFYVVNTSSFTPSVLKFSFSPTVMAIAPSGNQAVVAASTLSYALEESVLDTQSNTIVSSLPPPSVPAGTSLGQGSSTMAFSSDGTSLWTALCTTPLSCTPTLVGQSFPSGNVIGEATLHSVGSFNSVVF